MTRVYPDSQAYNATQASTNQAICDLLASQIDLALAHAGNKT